MSPRYKARIFGPWLHLEFSHQEETFLWVLEYLAWNWEFVRVAAPGRSLPSLAARLSAQPLLASPRESQSLERHADLTVSAQGSASSPALLWEP
ncbi:hypothetical protein AAY473_003299 [Plecturocebus cupreus]